MPIFKSNAPGTIAMNNTIHPSQRIFISHSSKDNEFGFKLIQDLHSALGDDCSVWYDASGGLHGGDTWWDKIKEELTASSIFIVILSPNALASQWVKDEARIAWKQKNSAGKFIIPVLYKPCEVPEDLDTLQVISFVPPKAYESAFSELLVTLRQLINSKVTEGTSSTNSEETLLVSQLIAQIRTAFRDQDWPAIIRKTNYILKQAPEAVSSDLYRMQGLAFLEEGQPQQAQEALDAALALVSDTQHRLNLLDEYLAILVSQGLWEDVLRNINEMLRLSPDSPRLLVLQREAQAKTPVTTNILSQSSSVGNDFYDDDESMSDAVSKWNTLLHNLDIFRQQNFSFDEVKVIFSKEDFHPISCIVLLIADVIVLPLIAFNMWLHIWPIAWVLAFFSLIMFIPGVFAKSIPMALAMGFLSTFLWCIVTYYSNTDPISAFVFCIAIFLLSVSWHIYLFYPRTREHDNVNSVSNSTKKGGVQARKVR